MNICLIATYVTEHIVGGREIHVKDLTEGLVKRNHKVAILTTKHPSGIKHMEKNGVSIYFFGKNKPLIYTRKFSKEFANFFEEVNKKEGFNIVHSQSPIGIGCIKYCKKHVPLVMTLHGTEYDEIKTSLNVLKAKNIGMKHKIKSIVTTVLFIQDYLKSIRFKCADGIIATSDEQARIINQKYFVDSRKIYTVYNGIDTAIFRHGLSTDIRKKYSINECELILSVARITEDKGIQNIICAMPYIVKEIPNAKLMIVGDGSYVKEIKKLAKKLGLEDSIIFTGTVSFKKLPYFFNACDVFVNPTIRQNGYDLTIVDAMACKKPVVVSNLGSVPTVVKHNVDGILVPPGDVNTLGKKVTKVLKDKKLASMLGGAARKKVVEKFSLDKMVENTSKVYKDVIRKHKWGNR